MSKLMPIMVFLSLFLSSAFATETHNLFWCDPSVHLKGLEAVIVRLQNDETVLAVYTTSRRWGATDEHLSPAQLNLSYGNYHYFAEQGEVNLEILTNGTSPTQPGRHYAAHFHDERFGFDMDLSCEFMP